MMSACLSIKRSFERSSAWQKRVNRKFYRPLVRTTYHCVFLKTRYTSFSLRAPWCTRTVDFAEDSDSEMNTYPFCFSPDPISGHLGSTHSAKDGEKMNARNSLRLLKRCIAGELPFESMLYYSLEIGDRRAPCALSTVDSDAGSGFACTHTDSALSICTPSGSE